MPDTLAAGVVIGLAAMRLWRLIALDGITERLRRPITEGSWVDRWLECPWCSGTWIAAATTLAVDAWSDSGVAAPVLAFGVAAAVTGWAGER